MLVNCSSYCSGRNATMAIAAHGAMMIAARAGVPPG